MFISSLFPPAMEYTSDIFIIWYDIFCVMFAHVNYNGLIYTSHVAFMVTCDVCSGGAGDFETYKKEVSEWSARLDIATY